MLPWKRRTANRPCRRPARQPRSPPIARGARPCPALRRAGRVAHAAQRVAQRREREPSQPPDAQRAQRQRQVVVAGTAAQPGGGPQAGESVAAAGDVVPLEGGGPQDLRHGQRQHGQVDAGQAHAEPAEHQRAQRRGQRPQQQRGLHRQRAELEQQRRAVGAQAEPGGVAETGHAGQPGQEMQAGGEQRGDQDFGQQDGQVRPLLAQQRRRDQQPAARRTPAAGACRRG